MALDTARPAKGAPDWHAYDGERDGLLRALPMYSRDPKYGINWDGTTADVTGNTEAMNAFFAKAVADERGAYWQAGRYKSNAMIAFKSTAPTLLTDGARTRLEPAAASYHGIEIGGGENTSHTGPNGRVEGFRVIGPGGDNGVPVKNNKCGVGIFGLIQCLIEAPDVVGGYDIGCDFYGNNYMSSVFRSRTGVGGSCNIGARIRQVGHNGGDMTFYDPCFGGREAGIWIDPQGQFRSYGGQTTVGSKSVFGDAANDGRGAVVMGKHYETGAVGEAFLDMNGMSFEGVDLAWCIRAYENVCINASGLNIAPVNEQRPAIGFYKNTNEINSVVAIDHHRITGYFSNPGNQLVVRGGGGGSPEWEEGRLYCCARNPRFGCTGTAGSGSTRFATRLTGFAA